jgi:hypothetical protein
LFGFFSAFNYNAIKDIQLYKGGFDAKFGGRISAVAEITGKEGNKKEVNAGADVNMLSANAYFEAPLNKKTTFLFAGRRSWKGPLYKKIFNRFSKEDTQTSGGFPGGGGGSPFGAFAQNQTANSYFYDLNSKLTFRPNKQGRLFTEFLQWYRRHGQLYQFQLRRRQSFWGFVRWRRFWGTQQQHERRISLGKFRKQLQMVAQMDR